MNRPGGPQREAWTVSDLRDPLQAVTDTVRDVVGFEVAAISVLRRDRRFEYVAVSSTDSFADEMLGHGNPLDLIEKQNELAERWGRFDFLAHGSYDTADEATWTPDISYPAGPDAWHPHDMLGTTLRSPDGSVIGMLSLDIPVNGRKPGPEQLQLMEAFAGHAERVLTRAMDSAEMTEKLRLADTARHIVRSASNLATIEEIIEECRPAIVDGFGVLGLWLQVFSDTGQTAPLVQTAAGKPIIVDPPLLDIAARAAHQAWAEQTVGVISSYVATPLVTTEESTRIRDFLDSIGVGSLLFVPLGKAESCLGNLVLTRGSAEQVWTDAECQAAQEIGSDLGQALFNSHLYARNSDLLDELQDLHDYKRTLVDMMVHELKNPLGAILGHVEIASAMSGTPVEVEESLHAIDRSAQRMGDIVENLLTLSRINDRTESTVNAPVDLVEVTVAVAELQRVSADAKGLTLVLDTPAQAWVRGDPETLGLVVSNLLSNAVKYTSAGGEVKLAITRCPREVVLTVRDTGLGISAEDQTRLFDEFFRSTNPIATREPGTGLGLTIVARVVEEHHGKVTVSSRLGEGTLLEVRLPALGRGRQITK